MTKTFTTYTVIGIIALAALISVLTFAPFAHADRVSARFDAGLVRQAAAPAAGDTGTTGGSNGGESGGGGSQGENPPAGSGDPVDPEAAAQEQLDGFIADATEQTDVGDIGDDVVDSSEEIDPNDIGGAFTGGSTLRILESILTRFRQ